MGDNTEDVFELLEMINTLSNAVLELYDPSWTANLKHEADMAEEFVDFYESLSKVDKLDYCLDIVEETHRKIRKAFMEKIKGA